jgi:ABC-type phosphate/phosphonate transport system substrate-binding protein
MKKLLVLFTLVFFGCSFPVQWSVGTPTPMASASATPALARTPPPTAEPGSDKNPLILALSPSPRPSDGMIGPGETIAAKLESLTGYRIVTVAPAFEKDLVDAFSEGNAHIAVLSPFAYLLARQDGSVTAALASVRNAQSLYGAQFIAHRGGGFMSFYDEVRGENIADAETALAQFKDKKPCWSDPVSPSGYVIPLGYLRQAGVPVRSGAFLEGQPSVVRGVYADGICDFGVTFIDARSSPVLEADYPDVKDKVIVIWRIPPIIPYEIVAFSSNLPLEMRRLLLRAFIDVMLMPEGKSAMQTIYGLDAIEPTEDSLYGEFQSMVMASGLELDSLIK